MSDHDHAEMNLQRSVLAPCASALLSSSVLARASAEAAQPGATCRLGDASCAAAHASGVSRSALGSGALLHRSLHRLQRDYGNAFVGRVLRQATGGAAPESGMDAVERSIDGARGGGHSLDHGTRGHMESAFGADFSGVRIHHDTRADGLSQALSARAFTTGKDVFFRQGEYSPGTSSGRELLAHELTHVVQQNGPGVQRKMSVSEPGDPHEVEADQMARAVMAREHTAQRQPEAPHDIQHDDEEKKKLHAKADATQIARAASDEQEPE